MQEERVIVQLSDEYRLSLYCDLGRLEDNEKIRLKRRTTDGKICVEKHVPGEMRGIYSYLRQNTGSYIPQIYECIESGAEVIIIEEYIEGRTLEEIVRERAMSEEEAAHIMIELCRGLKPLHHAVPPIVCRDLKPENIMMDNKSRIKIVDFNIARAFQEGKKRDTVLLGTAGYAAPEQFGFSQTDNRTDIYALGVLLNYLLTRQFPVDHTAAGRLNPIIQKCIHVDRERRFQCVEELEKALLEAFPQWEKDTRRGSRTGENNIASRITGFLPPGFRSRNPKHMIIATAGYLFLLCYSFTLEFTADGKPLPAARQWMERSALFLSLIATVFVIWNYRGWKERIPFVNQQERWKRVLGYIAVFFLTFLAAVTVSVLLESILF